MHDTTQYRNTMSGFCCGRHFISLNHKHKSAIINSDGIDISWQLSESIFGYWLPYNIPFLDIYNIRSFACYISFGYKLSTEPKQYLEQATQREYILANIISHMTELIYTWDLKSYNPGSL